MLLVVLGFTCTVSVSAQNKADTTTATSFKIEHGTILTGFSLGWTKASRDDYSVDFEQGFTRLVLRANALYFLNDRIGVGPIFGYQYVYRDFESTPGNFGSVARDRWEWNLEYGVMAGWYTPLRELFEVESLGDSRLFLNAGISWLSRTTKTEGFERTGGLNDLRFGYQAATGLLIPLGKQIAIETELQWEARKRKYIISIRDETGSVISTTEETKWPSVLSLGIGFKVKL